MNIVLESGIAVVKHRAPNQFDYWSSQMTKRKRITKNAKYRQYALRYFSRGSKYTDNILLALSICEETSWDKPENALESRRIIAMFYHICHPKGAKAKSSPNQKFRPKTNKQFYVSSAWRTLRYLALTNCGGACQCCGAKASDGVKIHVDHIKPRSKYPKLELDIDNMQVLCSDCNLGKSNIDDTNWRQHWESI